MFILKSTNDVLWPVTVQVPVDGGAVEECAFSVRFEILPWDEFNSLAKVDDFTLLERVVIGWSDLVDANRSPLEFSAETRARLVRIPFAQRALIAAYQAAANGAAAKN